MDKLNSVTLFGTECPKCKNSNPDKSISFNHEDSKDREEKTREAMRCKHCGYDIYTHKKGELI